MHNKFIYFTMIFVFLVLFTGMSAANQGISVAYVYSSDISSANIYKLLLDVNKMPTSLSGTKILTAGDSIIFSVDFPLMNNILKPVKKWFPSDPKSSHPSPHKYLKIDSFPPGAEIYINNKKNKEKTPLNYKVDSLENLLIGLKLDGYNSWEGQYDPIKNLIKIKGSSKTPSLDMPLTYNAKDKSYVLSVTLNKIGGK